MKTWTTATVTMAYCVTVKVKWVFYSEIAIDMRTSIYRNQKKEEKKMLDDYFPSSSFSWFHFMSVRVLFAFFFFRSWNTLETHHQQSAIDWESPAHIAQWVYAATNTSPMRTLLPTTIKHIKFRTTFSSSIYRRTGHVVVQCSCFTCVCVVHNRKMQRIENWNIQLNFTFSVVR